MFKSGLRWLGEVSFHGRGEAVPYLEKGLQYFVESLGEFVHEKCGMTKIPDVAFLIKIVTPQELEVLSGSDFTTFTKSQTEGLFDYGFAPSYESNGRHLLEAALDALALRIKKGPRWEDANLTGNLVAYAMSFKSKGKVVIISLAGVPRGWVVRAVTDHFGRLFFPRPAA